MRRADDANGNTLTKSNASGTTTYNWDFENRLTSVTLPNGRGAVNFRYDPFGRRVQKSSAGGTTNYLYDGSNAVDELDATGAALARYAQSEEVDAPLAMVRGGASAFYHADGLGSISSLSNQSGTLAETYTFDAFGNKTTSAGSLTNPFQYTAREFDTETSLYYYRARYYDSTAGRLLGEDPVRSPLQPNLYRYVRNSPPNRIDSSGMTDQPPYPPGMFGKHRGCRLVGVLSLTLWTNQSGAVPASDWSLVMAHQEGPEGLGEEVGVPLAAIDCVWERTYSAELWGHVLTTYTYKCWSDNCTGHHEWTDHRFRWSVEDLGKTTGTERTTTHHLGFGAEDETNEILCLTDPKFRP